MEELEQFMTCKDSKRFFAKVSVRESGCWEWLGAPDPKQGGYGSFYCKNSKTRSHRFAYEHIVGPIPEGMDLHHKCRNKICVNPEHLAPLGRSDHLREDWKTRYRASRCPKGHEFTEENTRIYKKPCGGMQRCCVECLRLGTRKQNAKRTNVSDMDPGRPSTNITEGLVSIIDDMLILGFTHCDISVALRISTSSVGRIALRKTWKHVPNKRRINTNA